MAASETLKRIFPIVGWLSNYQRKDLSGDIIAGLTTAVLLVPQGMAYAMLAGLPPEVGLYASIVPMVAYAIFGTSRQLSVGPVAIDSLLVVAGVSLLAEPGSEQYVTYAVALALMVGLLQVAMGLLRMGFFVNFLARPTIVGFTAAAALVIGASQLPNLLGVQLPRSSGFIDSLSALAGHIGGAHVPTALLGGATVAVLIALKRVWPRAPRALIAVIGTTAISVLLSMGDGGLQLLGSVPSGLPSFGIPEFTLDTAAAFIGLAITIALVSFMETISAGKQFARTHGYDLAPNRELIGIGAANITGSFFGGYPVAGGLSRSVVNDQAGAKTQLASFVTSGTVALSLILFTPWFALVPKATLAAIIIVAVAGLVDVKEMKRLTRVKRADFAVTAVTFVATLGLGIQLGILVGVATSIAAFLFRTTNPHAAVLGRVPNTTAYRNVENFPEAITWDHVLLVRIDAQFYFGNVTFLKDTLDKFEHRCKGDLRFVIIDASSVNQLDSSADAALHQLAERYSERCVRLFFANVKHPVRLVMERSGLVERLGEERFFLSVHDAVCCVLGRENFCTDRQAHKNEDTRMLDLREHVTLTADDVPEVSVEWLQDNQANVRIVDVREAMELAGPLGAIEAVEHISLGELSGCLDDFEDDEPVVFVCRSGGRSGTAAHIFERAGKPNVASLAGGMQDWNVAGLPTARR